MDRCGYRTEQTGKLGKQKDGQTGAKIFAGWRRETDGQQVNKTETGSQTRFVVGSSGGAEGRDRLGNED